jgi:hypothetical protein
MNIKQWCNVDESLIVAETDEIYKKYSGLAYSNKIILYLSKLRFMNSKLFLDSYDEPVELYVSAADSFVESSTRDLELKLHDQRTKKIVSKKRLFTDGRPINWNNWRQFNSQEKDSGKRKEVFDEFIIATKDISPIIFDRFKKIKKLYSKINDQNKSVRTIELDPLNSYLYHECISYEKLVDFVTHMGNKARKPFEKTLKDISSEILGHNAEYYDDFYFFRNKVYDDFQKVFHKIDPIKEVKKILKILSFDLSKISFDFEDRKDKYPYCFSFHESLPYSGGMQDFRFGYKGCVQKIERTLYRSVGKADRQPAAFFQELR